MRCANCGTDVLYRTTTHRDACGQHIIPADEFARAPGPPVWPHASESRSGAAAWMVALLNRGVLTNEFLARRSRRERV